MTWYDHCVNYFQAETFSLKKGFTLSLSVHFLVLALIVLEPRLFPSRTIPISAVYRVNLVALPAPAGPASAGPAAEAPAVSPTAPAGPKVISKVAVKKSPAAKPKASAPAKKTVRPAAPPKPVDRGQELSQAIAAIKKDLVQKIESQTGSDLVVLSGGNAEGKSDPAFQNYLETISEKIKAAWAYPAAKPRQQLIVIIKIRADGQIVDSQVEKSSTDPAYDASALRAIQKANPLPPLPSLRYGRTLEIGLRF